MSPTPGYQLRPLFSACMLIIHICFVAFGFRVYRAQMCFCATHTHLLLCSQSSRPTARPGYHAIMALAPRQARGPHRLMFSEKH